MSAHEKNKIFLLTKIISPQRRKLLYSFFCFLSRHRRASLTVEAALVLPIFFFTFFFLWQVFLLLMFQLKVCEGVTEAAKSSSHLGYIRQMSEDSFPGALLYEPLFWAAVPEEKRVYGMRVLCKEDAKGSLCVKVTYEFACEALFFTGVRLPVEQCFWFYPYFGEGECREKGSQEDVVYVTEHGTVYHESKACGYLTVVLSAVPVIELPEKRNSSGERYTECSRCSDKTEVEMVYISKGGNRYHTRLDCPAVKRNIQEIKRNETGDMPACHKCKERKDEE